MNRIQLATLLSWAGESGIQGRNWNDAMSQAGQFKKVDPNLQKNLEALEFAKRFVPVATAAG